MLSPRQRWLRTTVLACGLVFALGALAGCGIFSPTETKDPPTVEPPEPYPLAITPDQLVANFIAAHNDKNYDEYRDFILHPDFEFHFATEDIDASGTAGGVWGFEEDTQSTRRMFKGEEGKLQSDGTRQTAVQSIVLNLFPVDAEWTNQVPAEFESDLYRSYNVDMTVTYTSADQAIVSGVQQFYVKRVTLEGGQQVYKLRVWRDTGQDSGG